MILCALGKSGEQREFLSKFSSLDLRIDSYPRENCEITRLEDFQMVGGGYNDRDPFENLFIPKTESGKKAVGGGQKLTYRYYVQDMAYAAFMEIPDEYADEIGKALSDPVWPIFLGRKNCIPSEIIFQGNYKTHEECDLKARSIAAEKGRKKKFSVLQEDAPSIGDVITLNDVPVQFGQHKLYSDRVVTIVTAESPDE